MGSYSIRDLERISNQKAHTIRIWEQRYGLLEPDRTDTNIRHYNDEQLKKLLNVCSLLKRGMKISRISKLSKSQMDAEIERMIREETPAESHFEIMTEQALAALTAYDGPAFERVFENAAGRFGIQDTYEGLLYPLLVRAGLMWAKDDILPAQEHFLSNLIRQKLFSAVNALPAPVAASQTWVLFLNEEEDHEIGLLFAYYLIRQRGQRVIYLGARVPFENLSHVVRRTKPSHLYSFVVRNQSTDYITSWITSLAQDFPELSICISGMHTPEAAMPHNHHLHFINSITSLIGMIKTHG